MGCSPQEEMNKQEKTEGTEENWQVSPFAPRPPVQSDRADRHEGKKMSGKKMKIRSEAITTPTSFLASPIFHPTFFCHQCTGQRVSTARRPIHNARGVQ
jgi:hypothetical protein